MKTQATKQPRTTTNVARMYQARVVMSNKLVVFNLVVADTHKECVEWVQEKYKAHEPKVFLKRCNYVSQHAKFI
jgi:hypothetical protein